MSVTNPNKTVDRESLECGGTARVTISFDAQPELKQQPADIVLLMDRSGSMAGVPLEMARKAARELIRTVAKASGSAAGDTLENGTRMSFVSFADEADLRLASSTDVAALSREADTLMAGGDTNHASAFSAADSMLSASTADRRIAILFTDGNTTAGPNPDSEAERLKESGVEIYCIGLMENPEPLMRWATAPAETHVAATPDAGQLERVFAEAAAEVTRAGALDMRIREELNPAFKVVRLLPPSHGVAEVLDAQTIRWTAGFVGAAEKETASLSFDVMEIGGASGLQEINRVLTYQDRQEQSLTFPNPQIQVNCGGTVVFPEPCPQPTTFLMKACEDTVQVQADTEELSGLGRIVQVNVVVRNVCPDKRTAVAVILTELDDRGVEHTRGSKTLLIPAQGGEGCRDVELRCIRFVVPESLSVSGPADTLCGERTFRTRVLVNYVDTDYVCCDPQAVVL